jgi:adenylate kinase
MRCVLIGMPGAGKGTQAAFLSQHYRIAHISTGDMIRAAMDAGTAIGFRAKEYVESGALVPDDLVTDLVKNRVSQADCRHGFVIDGFPRTRAQADALRRADVDIDLVVEIDIAERDVLQRMGGRRVHPASGRVYHTIFNPPKVPDRDDITGEALVQRPDDRDEIVRKRIGAYYSETVPVISYYLEWERSRDPRAPRFVKVFGFGTVYQVRDRLLPMVSKLKEMA